MRLDAREGDTGFDIYDAKRCCAVPLAVWVDDTIAQWGGYGGSIFHADVIHQEDRIAIYLDRKLIVFNPIDDEEPESVEQGEQQLTEVMA